MIAMKKLGKAPARPDAIKLKLDNYIDRTWLLHRVPHKSFGFDGVYPSDSWNVLGNDSAGCCVFSGAAHEVMLWNRVAKADVQFDAKAVLSDYSAVTGYVIGNDASDNGTDMQTAAKYRQDTGIIDARGNRHKISAYLAIDPGNLTQLKLALWLFKAVGIGINVPNIWMDDFDQRRAWDVSTAKGSMICDGGHYVPAVGFRDGNINTVTWGRIQPMTVKGFQHQCDEAIAYLSPEFLSAGKSPDGFDLAGLQADLAYVTAPKTVA